MDTKEASVGMLNELAAEYPGGLLSVRQVIKTKDGRYGVQWQIVFGDDQSTDSCLWFINPGGFQPTKAAAIEKELDELKERITMDIFGTELFPYLQGEMFGGKEVTLTIKSVKIEELASNRGKESKPVIYFKERPKGLILNKTNAKAVVKLYGRETNDWVGKKITMYTEAGEWFGKPGLAIRVRDKAPKAPAQNGKAEPEPVKEFDIDPDEVALAEMIFNEEEAQADLFPH